MTDVFISYKREERGGAERLAKALSARGFSVWWDADILPGEKYRARTLEILQTCRVVIVLWSPQSIASSWVLDEAQRALDRGILVPVKIEAIDAYPLGFGQVHAHDLVGWKGDLADTRFGPVLAAVERLAGAREKRDDDDRKQPAPQPLLDAKLRRPFARWEIGFIALVAVVTPFLAWPIVNLTLGGLRVFFLPDYLGLFDITSWRSVFWMAPLLTGLAWLYDRIRARVDVAVSDERLQLAARFTVPLLLLLFLVLTLRDEESRNDWDLHLFVWMAAVWVAALTARRAAPWLRARVAALASAN